MLRVGVARGDGQAEAEHGDGKRREDDNELCGGCGIGGVGHVVVVADAKVQKYKPSFEAAAVRAGAGAADAGAGAGARVGADDGAGDGART